VGARAGADLKLSCSRLKIGIKTQPKTTPAQAVGCTALYSRYELSFARGA